MSSHVLEPEAQAFAEATAAPPFLYELGPEGARKVLDQVAVDGHQTRASFRPERRNDASGSRTPVIAGKDSTVHLQCIHQGDHIDADRALLTGARRPAVEETR